MAFVSETSSLLSLIGTDDFDLILGFAGDDVIDADDGNDFLIAGFGNDALEGGGGDDVLVDSTNLAGGPASVSRIQDDDVMNGGDGDDVLVSTIGNDIMNGDDGNDTFLIAGSGLKIINGGAGDDVVGGPVILLQSFGPVSPINLNTSYEFDGGDGNDTLELSAKIVGTDFATRVGDTQIFFSGGDGNDTLEVDGLFVGDLTFLGGAGDDGFFKVGEATHPGHLSSLVVPGNVVGQWTFDGGDGNDTLEVRGLFVGDLTFFGGAGDDGAVIELEVPSGFSTGIKIDMDMGAGDDSVDLVVSATGGEPGSPSGGGGIVQLGDGNDTLEIDGLWNLTVFGGAGDDCVVVSFPEGDPAKPFVTGPVFGGAGDDSLTEMPPFELVRPTGEKLFFSGGDGNDVLTGGGSDNFVEGGAGRDILDGGLGNDHLDGGAGPDSLTGGPGNDKFVFGSPEEGPDSVHDFTPGVDQILVSASTFGGGLAPGGLAADQFVAGSDPLAVGGQGVFLYDTDDGALAWDADGADGNPAITIATLLNQPALSAADFVIF
jgi:Ca2+-binding RTX toxin-like protein